MCGSKDVSAETIRRFYEKYTRKVGKMGRDMVLIVPHCPLRSAGDKKMIGMAKQEESERWLTPEEAASLLKLSIKTVRRKLRSQELKGYRAGVQWRIKSLDIQAYLDKNTADYHEQKEPREAE